MNLTIDQRRQAIREHLLGASRYIQRPNFDQCAASDLRLLFIRYDVDFFDSQLAVMMKASGSTSLKLELSGRLRSTGGRTTMMRLRTGVRTFGITVSSNVLFNNFRKPTDRAAEVGGMVCTDRVDALMRIFEHELVHLYEMLKFGNSNCRQVRFKKTIKELFGHVKSHHTMITSREATLSKTPFRPGHMVQFSADSRMIRGIVNRINKRATVLVESSTGRKYTDGKKYVTYYVPISKLKAVG